MQISLPMITAVAKQPRLWTTALKAYRSLVPEKWWTRRPFLPLPDADWMHFRLETAYGGDGTPADSAGEELTTWLNWLKD